MTPEQVLELVRTGGTVGVLVLVVAFLLTDRVVTARSRDLLIGFWREVVARSQADRDDWKEQAKAAVHATERMADALEAQNRLLEDRTRGGR